MGWGGGGGAGAEICPPTYKRLCGALSSLVKKKKTTTTHIQTWHLLLILRCALKTDFRWSQSKVERSRGRVYDFINIGNSYKYRWYWRADLNYLPYLNCLISSMMFELLVSPCDALVIYAMYIFSRRFLLWLVNRKRVCNNHWLKCCISLLFSENNITSSKNSRSYLRFACKPKFRIPITDTTLIEFRGFINSVKDSVNYFFDQVTCSFWITVSWLN